MIYGSFPRLLYAQRSRARITTVESDGYGDNTCDDEAEVLAIRLLGGVSMDNTKFVLCLEVDSFSWLLNAEGYY